MQTKRMTLTDAWQRLSAVRSVRFSAKSGDHESGWSGAGTGAVEVTITGNSTITFTEHGTWTVDSGRRLDFRNIYRWTFDRGADTIGLEYLRHTPNRPVFLLYLAPADKSTLESASPHHCGEDVYEATVKFEPDAVDLCWRNKGPKKDAVIRCKYAESVGPRVG
ncbi:MAG: DUF6314 family protein [Planctomycetota bacterium]|jgi:hypothetical protein